MAAIGIAPADSVARRCRFQGSLRGIFHGGAIGMVQGFADLAAKKSAQKRACGDRDQLAFTLADLAADDGAANSAQESSQGLLLATFLTGRQGQGNEPDGQITCASYHGFFHSMAGKSVRPGFTHIATPRHINAAC